MKKYVVFAFLIGFVLSLAGCTRLLPVGDLSGYVVDCYTSESIGNVTITLIPETPTQPFNNTPTLESTINPTPGVGLDPTYEEVISTSTASDGYYAFHNLKVGMYTLIAERPGYERYTESVYIDRSYTNSLDIWMNPVLPAEITGIVTDGRGGMGVADACVSYGDYSTITDANGYFSMNVASGLEEDLFVTHDDRGTARVQSVKVPANETLYIEIPTRAAFSPAKSFNPPSISLSVYPGQVLSGTVTVDLTITSDEPVFVYYIYLGGEQRYPNNGFATYADQGQATIDTTLYPNGDSVLRVMAYDDNGNVVIYLVPVYIENDPNDMGVPSSILALDIESYSFGTNIVFYGQENNALMSANLPIPLKTDEVIKPEAAPENATLYNRLYWYPDIMDYNTDGYTIYRSFDGFNYVEIGNVYQVFTRLDDYGNDVYYCRYDDWSAQLAPNKTTYYRVVPYNSTGAGIEIEGYVTPLPTHNVLLQTPANGDNAVPLTPTFTWDTNWSETPVFGMMTYSLAIIDVWDATDYIIWEDFLESYEGIPSSYTLPGALAPGGVYSWDIVSNVVQNLEYASPYGVSVSMSVSGEYTTNLYGTGSINGEFVFTTTTGIQ